MKHLTEEELIAYHYAHDDGQTPLVDHLASCALCRNRYQGLQRLLRVVDHAVLPERDENYGREVWRLIAPRLCDRQPSAWRRILQNVRTWHVPRSMLIPALGLLVVGAFLAGRFLPRSIVVGPAEIVDVGQPISPEARQRILLSEIGEHLERSQLALIELINNKTNGIIDISAEQALARQLVEVNRLYRHTAARAGDARLAGVLDDLERTLIEIAYSAPTLSGQEFTEFQERFDGDDLLFKIKILTTQLREREKEHARNLAGTGG